MKKKTVKILAIVLAILTLLSTFAITLTAFAAPETLAQETPSDITTLDNQTTTVLNETGTTNTNDAVSESETKNELEQPEMNFVIEEDEENNETKKNSETNVVLPNKHKMVTVNIPAKKDAGYVKIVFKNIETNEEYVTELGYKDSVGYTGELQLPLGTYKVKQKKMSSSNAVVHLTTKEIELRNTSKPINLDGNVKRAGFGYFLKNNMLTLILLIGAIIFYIVYKRKMTLEERQRDSR